MAKRLPIFIFGVMAYLIFLLTALYGIGFVGNELATKSIDTGDPSPWVIALVIDLFLLALFGFQHSLMARRTFKDWLTRGFPKPIERSLYVLCASLTLWLLFWQWRPIAGYIWNFPVGWPHFILTALYWVGWVMVVLSTFLINHFDLFGLRQVCLYMRGIAYTPMAFKRSAVYDYVRHPLMLSFLIAFWVTPQMSVGHFVFAVGMTAYIILGIRFEERDLLKTYGTAYEKYRQQVPMLLPFPRKK